MRIYYRKLLYKTAFYNCGCKKLKAGQSFKSALHCPKKNPLASPPRVVKVPSRSLVSAYLPRNIDRFESVGFGVNLGDG
jgi:hypothetical protein